MIHWTTAEGQSADGKTTYTVRACDGKPGFWLRIADRQTNRELGRRNSYPTIEDALKAAALATADKQGEKHVNPTGT